MSYAVCCKSCGNIEAFAYTPNSPDDPKSGQRMKTERGDLVPLTPRGHVPAYCLKCGKRDWRVPATAEDIAKRDAQIAREARATELCRTLNMDGLFKIPDEIKGTPEIKNALSNLLAPLDGEVLERAQSNAIKASRSGIAAAADVWVDLYERAVEKAKQKGAKAA
jgi:hypothetical protein